MPYIDQSAPHAGSAEVLFTSMFDEPAGTLARTIPRGSVTGAGLTGYTTGGQVCARAIALPQGLPVTNIAILMGTGATGPTHMWHGLTDQNLNVLAVSADQGSAAVANNSLIKLAMTVPFVTQYTGLYYIVTSASASTTAPLMAGAVLATGAPANSGNPVFCGPAGTQATPPAIGSQLNGGTVTPGVNMNFAAWIS